MSIWEAAWVFGLHRDTVRKMLTYSAPPGYRRQTPPRRPKLEPFTGVIDRILKDDHRVPGSSGTPPSASSSASGTSTVSTADIPRSKTTQERIAVRPGRLFVPLSHAPGHAQCDFGEALVVIGGVERKAHCFVIDLPHSDGCFVKTYSAEDHRGFPGRPRLGVRLPGRSAPEHPLRQYQAGCCPDPGRRPAPAHPRLHRAPVSLPVRGPVRPPRQGQRQG